MQEEKKATRFWEKNSVSSKLIVIGVLALLLLIPSAMVQGLIREREVRNDSVTREVGSKWGSEQTLTGPVLKIPYIYSYIDSAGKRNTSQRVLYMLPEMLAIKSNVEPQKRTRGIYEAVVYSSDIRMSGNFDLRLLKQSGVRWENILFHKATILLGIADMKGVREQIAATLNGQQAEFNPGLSESLIPSSVGTPVAGIDKMKNLDFEINVNLNGNGQLKFIPVGKQTRVTMNSPWPSPSFSGSFLPVERSVGESGFTANWRVLHFNRDLPQLWANNEIRLDRYAFGVSFIIPADIYQQSMRSAKYAVLFIGFTFGGFFIAEILNRKRIHPVQYLLIGFALMLFYVLLISISEHLSFAWAYLASTVATIAMIASYAVSVLKSRRMGSLIAAILASLYGYMYVLLNLEDYSLLMGGIGLFVMLAAIMYLTRRIDWYAGSPEPCT